MNEKIIVGKSDIIHADCRYVLLKEQKGYIFRRVDNPTLGWCGHHATVEESIENFKSLCGNVVIEVSF
jgi:hypothetical protein